VENLNDVEVEVNVPERDVADRSNDGRRGFDAADLARLTAEINPLVSLSARPDQSYPARFTEVATRANAATRTFAVRLAVDTPDDVVLLPGMTARITGRFRSSQDAVNIPLTALVSKPDGAGQVWVIHPETNLVSAREVALGQLVDDQIIVTAGLVPGEIIAATGAHLLVDGMQVKRFK
jgi:RND family efflux transporter MFP subunit